jgi:hypothetical protein
MDCYRSLGVGGTVRVGAGRVGIDNCDTTCHWSRLSVDRCHTLTHPRVLFKFKFNYLNLKTSRF